MSKGEDTIPYGYHWVPSTNHPVQARISPPTIPDHLLYTLVYPSSTTVMDGENDETAMMEYDDTEELIEIGGEELIDIEEDEAVEVGPDVDLMETDDYFEAESYSDIEFLDNTYELENKLSFYRQFDNAFSILD